MFHRCLAVILGVLLTAPPTLAQAPASPNSPSGPLASNPRPAEFRISDRVILVRDERMVQTHFTLVVHAGCLDEEPDCRGVAHYLEHLLLAGRNPDHTESASRFFSDGYANGWTTHKATAFVHRIAPRRAEQGGPMADLERLFAFYANRLRSFEVSAADAVRERNVVLQEYQLRTGNNPFGRFGVQLEKVLFPHHSLGQPVIGSPETITALTLEQAQRFHARWYAAGQHNRRRGREPRPGGGAGCHRAHIWSRRGAILAASVRSRGAGDRAGTLESHGHRLLR